MKISKFSNAYGISELKFNYSNEISNSLIYASNGVFKTSFSKTMEKWGEGNATEVIDRLTNDVFEGEILFNGQTQTQNHTFNSCLIYKVDSKDFLTNVQNLIISKNMQEKLKNSKSNLQLIETNFGKVLKKCKINMEKYIDEFYSSDIERFYKIYNAIKAIYETPKVSTDFSKLDFGQIFSQAYKALFQPEIQESIKDYSLTIENRMKSEFFDQDFTESNFRDVISNLRKNKFLNSQMERSIIISNIKFLTNDELEWFYSELIDEIFDGEDVINAYNNVKKILGSAKAVDKIDENLKSLDFIEIISMKRLEIFNKRLRQEYGDDELEMILNDLEEIRKDLDNIYKEANLITNDFQEVVDEFIIKFQPVFDIEITNPAESVLGVNTPKLKFNHKSNIELELDRETLGDILSSGEKSALYILEFMFRLKSKLANVVEDEILVIMDDVIETFDYANRNGFIEYIKELTKNERIKLLVLTHNYEFYKSLHYRCRSELFPHIAERDTTTGKIIVSKNWDFANSGNGYLRGINDIKKLIVAIPFTRQILSNIGTETSILTSCLHYKKGEVYTLEEVIDALNVLLDINKEDFLPELLEKDYYDLLYEHSDYKNESEIELKDKIIYSIASRIFIEKKAVDIKVDILDGITKNQTAELYDRIVEDSDFSYDFKRILKRVILITPSFIHIDSFMYNPLVDIPSSQYFELLKSIKLI